MDRVDLSAQGRQNKTVFSRAAASGLSALASSGRTVSLLSLLPSTAGSAAGQHTAASISKAQEVLQQQPELVHLPALLKAYKDALPVETFAAGSKRWDMTQVSVVNTGVIGSAQVRSASFTIWRYI
jgi:hypothetical protein